MDSLSQAALGAGVGVAVMGRTRPVWQAALAGALAGTLPDLDVFVDKGDPIRNMVLHRAETHAVFWQAIAAPLIAGLLTLVTRTRASFARWWVMVTLALFTHSMLDAMTIYGTRLALPFSDQPFGLGSLFIIDPLYTLPLLVGLLMALVLRGTRRLRWNQAGLALSTAYAAWAIGAQAHVAQVVRSTPEARDLSSDRILVTATPFNTLVWRIVLVRDDHYDEGFYSLLDPLAAPGRRIRFDRFERGEDLDRRTGHFEDANLVRTFTRGFYALSDDGRRIWITDLRMGQTPYYPFRFAFAEHLSEPFAPIAPLRASRRLPHGPASDWLWQRLLGRNVPPPR